MIYAPLEANYADRATWLSAMAEFERNLALASSECICSVNEPLTSDQRLEFAHLCASLACNLDCPGTGHLSDILHDVAEELAGDRVDEVYMGGDDEQSR